MGLRQVRQWFSSFLPNFWLSACSTLKNHQICQKFGKKWRKALCNLLNKHISKSRNPEFEYPIHHLCLEPLICLSLENSLRLSSKSVTFGINTNRAKSSVILLLLYVSFFKFENLWAIIIIPLIIGQGKIKH